MQNSLVKNLVNGVYLIHWKTSQGGGASLAAVGTLANGNKWLAPTNWVSPTLNQEPNNHWRKVSRVTLISCSPEQYCAAPKGEDKYSDIISDGGMDVRNELSKWKLPEDK
jgi:hypothetical protein